MIAKVWAAPAGQHYLINPRTPYQPPRLADGDAPDLLVVSWHEGQKQLGSASGAMRGDEFHVGFIGLQRGRLRDAIRAVRRLFPCAKGAGGVRVTERGCYEMRVTF